VLDDSVIVGRILLSAGAPQDRQWMWASGHNGDICRAAHGYESPCETVMAAFAEAKRQKTLQTLRSLDIRHDGAFVLLRTKLVPGKPIDS
jgi:hypothetical protein